MMKFNYLIMMMPMLINLVMIFIMMIPSKINKFHPISLMLILMLLTFMICLKMNFIYKTWISFILFLILIGSLMIIYMYITSLANNEFFTLNFKLLMINFFKISPMLILLLIMMIYFKFLILNMNLNEYFLNNMNLNNFNHQNINILYKELMNKFSIYLMIYLYYSMICIMNICYKLKVPLRQLMF